MIDIAKAWHSAEMISTAKAEHGEESNGKANRGPSKQRQSVEVYSGAKAKR